MLDKLYITPRQWLRILRWTLYAALFLLALLVQTVVFGNRTILGAHPDLVAIVIIRRAAGYRAELNPPTISSRLAM